MGLYEMFGWSQRDITAEIATQKNNIKLIASEAIASEIIKTTTKY